MTTIKLKNGSGAPTAGDLVAGEPALDLTNKRLYTEDSGGTVIEVGTNPGTDVTFADNRKAIFGAGSDLQIYHDGSNSFIADVGTGNLGIRAENLFLQNADGSENYATATVNGAFTLSYDNSQKLATTATGIDVTGTVTADGLTSSGNLTFDAVAINTISSNGFLYYNVPTGYTHTFQNNSTNALSINGQDISFYEDTGTTAKLFWDASAESLGIGTTSPTETLDVSNSIAVGLNIKGTGANTTLYNPSGDMFVRGGTGSKLSLGANNTNDLMVLDSSGNVGIGTSSPATGLEVGTTNYTFSGTTYDIYGLFGDTSGGIRLGADSSNDDSVIGTTGTNNLQFVTYNGSAWGSRMTLDNTGNVGIGTSSPSGSLHVQSASSGGSASAGGDELILESSATTGLTILSGTANDGNILFGDSGNAAIGYLQYKHADNALVFGANNAERMRIDSSGNLLVGTTDTVIYDNNAGSSADNGLVYDASASRLDVTRYTTNASSAVALLNKTGSDGAILELRKAGTTVGSIGCRSSGSNLYIDTGESGIDFGGDGYLPMRNGSITDNSIDIGSSSYRYKDLYLSGGVYLGGTGTANKLDDYEEGTFTLSASAGTLTYLYGSSSTYTKIGNRVIIDLGQLQITGVPNNTTTFTLSGLPFSTVGQSAIPTGFVNTTFGTSSATQWFNMYVEANQIYISKRNTSYLLNNADITGGTYQFSGGGSAYRTT